MTTPRRTIQTRQERQQSNATIPRYINGIVRIVKDCVRLTTSDNVPPDTLIYCIKRFEAQERTLLRAQGSLLSTEDVQSLLDGMQDLLRELRKGNSAPATKTSYNAQRNDESTGNKGGAPGYSIPREQLEFLISCGFTIRRISQLIGVSRRTIIRRMRKYQLSKIPFSRIPDNELDELITKASGINRKLGPNAVMARLTVMGYKLQRWRVRDGMLRVDPGGSALRTSVPTKRRTYRVAGPNSVWHLDGNHKLIRWRFVIHGAIDGYSRLFVFLQASDNNRQETVCGAFVRATDMYNVPSRICVDSGGENNSVCRVMEMVRGEGRGSAIRCKSVHNQRIERAWVDTWNGATNVFYGTFQFLEDRGFLDIENDEHMWALHYIFLPRINAQLKLFTQQWNNHGLRTEHHSTPLQKFVSGSLESCHSTLTAMQDLFPHHNSDGRSAEEVFNAEPGWGLDVVQDCGMAAVEVPSTACPLDVDTLIMLKATINPLQETPDIGMDLYLKTLEFIETNKVSQ